MVKVFYKITRKDGAYCSEQYAQFKTKKDAKKRLAELNPGIEYEISKVKSIEENKHIIFDSYDSTSDENMEGAKETFLCNAERDEDGNIVAVDNFGITVKLSEEEYLSSISKDDLYEECYRQNEWWFNDELSLMKRLDEGSIIAIADLGLWNGRRVGYKNLKGLSEVLYSSCDYETVYVDSNGDLRKHESHHDGSNSILYRYWKDSVTEEQKDNFTWKCYNGELTRADITRYTRKAGVKIAEEYGWKVRK